MEFLSPEKEIYCHAKSVKSRGSKASRQYFEPTSILFIGFRYRNEMAEPEKHKKLLSALLKHQGSVIISGYDNDLYNQMLSGWHKEQKKGRADNAAARTETIWLNYHNQLSFYDI